MTMTTTARSRGWPGSARLDVLILMARVMSLTPSIGLWLTRQDCECEFVHACHLLAAQRAPAVLYTASF